jgi:hypothetical protein
MISEISSGLSEDTYTLPEGVTKGQKLEELLYTICISLGEIGSLTENKADVEFLLSIVGTYIISKNKGELPEDVVHPNELFDRNLFPMLANYTVHKEEIKEDE